MERISERARRDDAETSHQAAAKVDRFAAAHYARILEALKAGPGTIYEVADRCGMSHVQVARRMPELEKGGRVRTKAGEVRRGPTGSKCRVWALVA